LEFAGQELRQTSSLSSLPLKLVVVEGQKLQLISSLFSLLLLELLQVLLVEVVGKEMVEKGRELHSYGGGPF